jgi:hypothetical protein
MDTWTRQLVEAAGNAAVTFVTGLLVFKGINEITQVGVWNAVWTPALQAVLVGLGSLGFQNAKRP